jgi:hypothetical protein
MNSQRTHVMDPCAKEAVCECSPAEFVRLRYFFGQRLGVLDLSDEQAYLVGKHRFHNARAHGVGVLCGLRCERYAPVQGQPNAPTTLLRVRRGAALDACGREVIVGWDQCIDVAAWYAQHAGCVSLPAPVPAPAPAPVPAPAPAPAPQPAPAPAPNPNQPAPSPNPASPHLAAMAPAAIVRAAVPITNRLWVALCYRECPSDPAPAPRDPCGCDSGGCEFARIREGFQLRLVTDEEARLMVRKPGPRQKLLDAAFANDPSAAEWARVITRLGALDCEEAADDPCLLLASFTVKLDAAGTTIVDISAPDNEIAQRQTLLPTWLLQAALLRTLKASGGTGALGDGPRYGALSFAGSAADAGTLSIAIEGDAALARDPLAAPAQLTVTVSKYGDDGTWTATPPTTVSYVAGSPASLQLDWANGLVDGARYRLLVETDHAEPPVDTEMRPLAPPSWARPFRLVVDAGVLTLADTLYP